MYINIITPCSRPENLSAMAASINIPPEYYRWIVVFDAPAIPDIELPTNAEYYVHQNDESMCGYDQRNHALPLVSDGYVMMLDDDTVLHPDLWHSVKEFTADIIGWKQCYKDGSHRLHVKFAVDCIDAGSFMVKRSVIGDTRLRFNIHNADGFFAEELFNRSTSNEVVDKYLSTYNYLR